MSGANAISGIVLIGAILLIRSTDPGDYIKMGLGAAAIVLADNQYSWWIWCD
jgi:H+-translocating NAD(P) transhydrogenase subunit alpha